MDLRFWRIAKFLAVAAAGLCTVLPAFAQSRPSTVEGITDGMFAEVHFDRWVAQGPVQQIPWDVEIESPSLSGHQRIATQVSIRVSSREFIRRGVPDVLKAFVQITDSHGHVYQSHLTIEEELHKKLVPTSHVQFRWGIFLLPGEYHLAVALADTTTGAHSFARKTLQAKPLKNDPLPNAWNGVPEVEFYGSEGDFERAYLPEIDTPLDLGIAPIRPVDLHIVVNIAVPERPPAFGLPPATASRTAYWHSLRGLLPIAKILSQLGLKGGARDIELIDATRHRVVYSQDNFQALDVRRMKAALESVDPNVIDVKSLQNRNLDAAFVRDRVLALLSPSAEAGNPSARPAQVVILLSHAMDLVHGKKLPPVTLPENCNCRLYYLRLRPSFLFGYGDDIGKALDGLKPRVSSVDSPRSFRKSLAQIIADVDKM